MSGDGSISTGSPEESGSGSGGDSSDFEFPEISFGGKSKLDAPFIVNASSSSLIYVTEEQDAHLAAVGQTLLASFASVCAAPTPRLSLSTAGNVVDTPLYGPETILGGLVDVASRTTDVTEKALNFTASASKRLGAEAADVEGARKVGGVVGSIGSALERFNFVATAVNTTSTIHGKYPDWSLYKVGGIAAWDTAIELAFEALDTGFVVGDWIGEKTVSVAGEGEGYHLNLLREVVKQGHRALSSTHDAYGVNKWRWIEFMYSVNQFRDRSLMAP